MYATYCYKLLKHQLINQLCTVYISIAFILQFELRSIMYLKMYILIFYPTSGHTFVFLF